MTARLDSLGRHRTGYERWTARHLPGDDWKCRAVCRDKNPDIWFPESVRGGTGRHNGHLIEAAKTICRSCPVVVECLEFALAMEQGWGARHGIWGCCTPTERDEIARRRRRS